MNLVSVRVAAWVFAGLTGVVCLFQLALAAGAASVDIWVLARTPAAAVPAAS